MTTPPENIPTPRTDFNVLVDNNLQGQPQILVHGRTVVDASFARQLEQELQQWKECAREMRRTIEACLTMRSEPSMPLLVKEEIKSRLKQALFLFTKLCNAITKLKEDK